MLTCSFFRKTSTILGLFLVFTSLQLIFSPSAGAYTIRVSQESSAGLSDFDNNVLGYVDSFTTPLSAPEYFSAGLSGSPYYHNTTPPALPDVSQHFFVETAEGLTFFSVHDAPVPPASGTAGMSGMKYYVFYDPSYPVGNVSFLHAPYSSGGDLYDQDASNEVFLANHQWSGLNGGDVIGSLVGNWSLLTEHYFLPSGVSVWQATSATGGAVNLALAAERRVRFDVVSAVPLPGAALLLGGGLVLMAGVRRMGKKRYPV